MKWLAFLFLSILIAPCSPAQEAGIVTPAMRKIYIEPVIPDYDCPSLRLGAELPLTRVFSVFTSAGLYGLSGSGYYLKGGIKKYWDRGKMERYFVGASLFYKNERYATADNGRDTNFNPISSELFTYNVSKRALGINAEIGQATYWRNWVIEGYAGLGLRIKTIRPSISDSLQKSLFYYNDDPAFSYTNGRTRDTFWPSLVLGIRAGYMLRRRD